MQIRDYELSNKYIRVFLEPEDNIDKDMLLGCRCKKGDPWLLVENNLINRIVLGLKIKLRPKDFCKFNFNENLEDYQVHDVKHMLRVNHILNANPMGLGKTIETIEYLRNLDAKSVLIVVPKIIRQQWVSKIKEWWGRDAYIYEKQPVISFGNIWIINYEKLINEKVLNKFRAFRWDVLVVDEAHKIKSRKSQRTIAIKSIPAGRRVALTGTPILRYVDDLWSILNFLDESYSGISYWSFVRYFCNIKITPWGERPDGITKDERKVKVLNKLLELVSVRNDSVEVAHGKSREIVKVPMSKAQRELYRKEKDLVLEELPSNLTIANGAVLTMRLMQTTSWPGLFLPDEAGPKFEWILETCKNAPEEKFVVFSVFEKTVSALVSFLQTNDVGATKITGKQDAVENNQSKEMFLKNPECRVLAGTIGAMGQGYDGLQEVSRLMIVIDRDWSPEIMNQCEDRLKRYGQKYPVVIYYLECTGSFDRHVGRVNEKKAEDIRRALNDEDTDSV